MTNMPFTQIKRYPKHQGLLGKTERKIEEAKLKRNGFVKIGEEEVSEYSGGKGCLLFLLFPPLAFFGKRKYIKVTWAKNQ